MPSRRDVLVAATMSGALSGCMSQVPFRDDDVTLSEGLEPTGIEPEDTTAIAQFQSDGQNTGRHSGSPPSSISETWRVDAESTIVANAATDDTAFVVNIRGLVAYDAATGDRRWENPFYHVMTRGTPAVAPDTVYVPIHGPGAIQNETAGIVAFDSTDGRVRWRAAPDLHVATPPTLHDGTVYACGFADNGYAIAVDARTGEEHWRQSIEELAVGEYDQYDTDEYWDEHEGLNGISSRLVAPAVSGNTAYVVAEQPPVLIALDTATGSDRWRVTLDQLDEVPQEGRIAVGAPTVYEGTIYIGTDQGGLYAIGEDGELRWTEAIDGGVTESIAVDSTGLYVPAETMLKLDHDDSLQWSTTATLLDHPLTITDRYVIAAEQSQAMMRRKGDGDPVWSFDPEPREISDVGFTGEPAEIAMAGTSVYVATDSRRLVAFQ